MNFDLERKNNDHLRPFYKVLHFVMERNSHLLNDDDRQVVDRFLALSEYAKFLFVRLFDRNYQENKEVRARKIEIYVGKDVFDKVLPELVESGLVIKIREAELPSVLEALTGTELKQIAAAMRVKLDGTRKQEMVRSFLKAVREGHKQTTFGTGSFGEGLIKQIQDCHGGTHYLSKQAKESFLRIYEIYYFDSGYDDKSASFNKLYLHGINQRRYFQYKIDSLPLFGTLKEMQEYQDAVAEDVYWGDDNKKARIEAANNGTESTVKRLDYVIGKVNDALERVWLDEGRFTSKYVWMRVAVKIGSQSHGALGKGERAKILYRQWQLLCAFMKQDIYAQHKRLVAITYKIHVETELYKNSNYNLEWLEKAHEDVKQGIAEAKQEPMVDPLMLDLDKKISSFQTQFNKRYKKYTQDLKKKKRNTNQTKPPNVSYKALVTGLNKVSETVVIGKTKVEVVEEPKPVPIKAQKQSMLSDYFGNNASLPKPRPKPQVETVVIFSDSDEEDDGFEVVEIKNSSGSEEVEKANQEPAPILKRVGVPTLWASKYDNRTIRVEDVALEHYSNEGWRGWHNEGLPLKTIFVFLFWDIIFMEGIPGVFYNHVQTAPLDMFTNQFYERRKDVIQQRLVELNLDGFIESKLRDVHAAVVYKKWDRKESRMRLTGPWVVGADFDRLDIEDIVKVANHLGKPAVMGICQIMSRDWYKYDSGLPDLCVINEDTQQCKMVEVKSKNDTLSDTQKVWIHHMRKLGVDVEVCRVLTQEQHDAPNKRRRKN